MATGQGGATPQKRATRGRTITAVDKDVKALGKRLDDMERNITGGFAEIADLLRGQQAQELNDSIQEQVVYADGPAEAVGEFAAFAHEDYDDDARFEEEDEYLEEPDAPIDPRDFQATGYARRQRKTPVGQRRGDKIIRNRFNAPLRMRLGRSNDPYRVNLEPNGTPGDTEMVPASLVNDLQYKRNLNAGAFEEITQEEFDALQNLYAGYSSGGFAGGYDAETVYDEDRTVYDVNKPQSWPGYTSGGIGPRFKDVEGSDRQVAAAARSAFGQDFSEEEQVKFRQWQMRQNGLSMPDPSDPSGREMASKIRRMQRERGQAQRRLAGQDRESAAMAAHIAKLEGKGVLPAGALNQPVTVSRGTVATVGPGGRVGGPSRRLPTENVPAVPRRQRG